MVRFKNSAEQANGPLSFVGFDVSGVIFGGKTLEMKRPDHPH
jgi:hypothetical protein